MSQYNPLFQGSLPTPQPPNQPADLLGAEPHQNPHPGHDQAAELVRSRLDALYQREPDAGREAAEAKAAKPRSRHQEYMYQLTTSGKSAAEIQTAWHAYYEQLSNDDKHQVWQEFYDTSQRNKQAAHASGGTHQPLPATHHQPLPAALPAPASHDDRTAAAVATQVRSTARRGGRKLTAKHHIQAVAFGLAAGGLALLITLFSFFNEVVIAPFIQPSRSAAATPIIIGTGDQLATGESKVIIPKINVEIPTIFDTKTIDDTTIEEALDRGVVHYPTTAKPGQNGNAAFFGHSSNNLLNKGKYKFAFLQLSQLIPGDTFYLTYDKTVYAYQVFDKKVVPPSQVGVLGPVEGQTATAALITCDPPGTSLNRLVVWGKQVSPDPAKNTKSTAQTVPQPDASSNDANLPGNGPTLFRRILNWFQSLI